MEWNDDAIILGLRKLGENGAILEALTREHGRHLGLVRGASSKRIKGTLEPGNAIKAHWRARLDDQLGSYTVELAATRAAHFFDDALKLAGLSSACAVAAATLPERENHTRVFEALDALLNSIAARTSPEWVEDYVRFEIVLLEDLGFGLDLTSCAATGVLENLNACFAQNRACGQRNCRSALSRAIADAAAVFGAGWRSAERAGSCGWIGVDRFLFRTRGCGNA